MSRSTVPYDLCDMSITIADSIIVEGKVRFMHPLANYTIIQYDPSLVDAPVKTAKLSTVPIKQGASTIFLGFNQNFRAVLTPTTVTDITTVAIPSNPAAPRYRAINLDAITVDTGLSGQCGSGVLIAEDGTIEALWLNYLGERSHHSSKDVEYHLGLSAPTLLPIIDQIRADTVPSLRILNIETNTVQMSQVRIMGVSESWISAVAAANPSRHQLFMVRKIDCPPFHHRRRLPIPERGGHHPDTQRATHHPRLRIRHHVQQPRPHRPRRPQRPGSHPRSPNPTDHRPRNLPRSHLLRCDPASPAPRRAPADLETPQRSLRQRPHARLPFLPIRARAHEFHHRCQRRADTDADGVSEGGG